MKERTDKRDFLTLAAAVSGFKVEWLDGVRPDDLHPKAMPDVRIRLSTQKLSVNT
jgi:hypothetical protein